LFALLGTDGRIVCRRDIDAEFPGAGRQSLMASRRTDLVLRGVGDDVEQPWSERTTGVKAIE